MRVAGEPRSARRKGTRNEPVVRRLDLGRVERLHWKGELAFRVLSYYFTIRWNWDKGGAYICRVLGPFAVAPDTSEIRSPPTPGLPPRYSLIDFGRAVEDRYCLTFNEGLMIEGREPSNVLHHLLWHINSEAIRHTGNFVLIHAGAVVTASGEALLLPGQSGSGKTTLVAALVQEGFGYLSDEAAAIDPITRMVYPYPRALTLKERRNDLLPGLSHLGNGSTLAGVQWHLLPEEIRPGAVASPGPVGFVIAPKYQPDASTTLTPMTQAKTVAELAVATLNLTTYGGRVLSLLADLSRRARSHRLEFSDLPEAVRLLKEVTGGGESPPPSGRIFIPSPERLPS